MKRHNGLALFSIDEKRYALHLDCVDRVIRSADITLLPRAPEFVMGVINVKGAVIPVFSIRKLFHLSDREIDLTDQFLISHTSKRPVAFWVDEVTDVIELSGDEEIMADNILPHMPYVESVIKHKDGIITVLQSPEIFLSLDTDIILDEAIGNVSEGP